MGQPPSLPLADGEAPGDLPVAEAAEAETLDLDQPSKAGTACGLTPDLFQQNDRLRVRALVLVDEAGHRSPRLLFVKPAAIALAPSPVFRRIAISLGAAPMNRDTAARYSGNRRSHGKVPTMHASEGSLTCRQSAARVGSRRKPTAS